MVHAKGRANPPFHAEPAHTTLYEWFSRTRTGRNCANVSFPRGVQPDNFCGEAQAMRSLKCALANSMIGFSRQRMELETTERTNSLSPSLTCLRRCRRALLRSSLRCGMPCTVGYGSMPCSLCAPGHAAPSQEACGVHGSESCRRATGGVRSWISRAPPGVLSHADTSEGVLACIECGAER